jgi:hypothetical protein
MSRFSNYIIYLDEYGTNDLNRVDGDNAVFIQNFCIFDKRHYSEIVVPKIQALKFRHFGHDGVFFDIDNARGPNQQQQFISDVNDIIEHSNFVLISCLLEKSKVEDKQSERFDEILAFGLDHSNRFLQERDQASLLTHVVSMGKDDDNNQHLQQTFRQVCEQKNKTSLPFELHLTSQNHRPLGIQFASLLSHPVLANHQHPEQENVAFELLKSKFYCKGGRKKVGQGYEGWGLARFPA